MENNPTENNNSSTTSVPALQVAPSVTASGRNRKTRRAKTSKYPKFVRSRSELIKIGWSKKEKKEYQHRAPWSVVQSLTRRLNNLRGEEFTTEEVLPLGGTDGTEIPSYQAYLCLAWLRMEEVIVKDGRLGYFIPKGNDVLQQAEKLWSNQLDQNDSNFALTNVGTNFRSCLLAACNLTRHLWRPTTEPNKTVL